MATYAIIKEEIVDSLFFAEKREPFEVLFGYGNEYVEITPETGLPVLGLRYKKGKFQPTQDTSWDKNEQKWRKK